MEFTKEIKFNVEPTANQNLAITYNGFLGNSSELSIIYGFGDSWEYTSETKMEKSADGFTAEISLLDFDKLNFCFRNSNNEWDNNSYSNYVCSISPCTQNEMEEISNEPTEAVNECQNIEKFDIDALLEEMLQPITIKAPVENIDLTTNVQPIDLGVEITNILSQIDTIDSTENLVEYPTLDEILSGSVIDESPIDLFEEQQETNNIQTTVSAPTEETTNTSLINIEDKFTVSPRKLSQFYLFRKRIKLAFYKALVKIPKLIFGSKEQNGHY